MDKWNLFLSTHVLLFDVLTILIHHFVLFFSILSQKEKFYVKRKNNTKSNCMIFFLRILCRMNIYFKRLIIYQSGMTIKISSTSFVTVLSNLQFNLIFSVLKKSCKSKYNCHSDINLSDIITFSRLASLSFL